MSKNKKFCLFPLVACSSWWWTLANKLISHIRFFVSPGLVQYWGKAERTAAEDAVLQAPKSTFGLRICPEFPAIPNFVCSARLLTNEQFYWGASQMKFPTYQMKPISIWDKPPGCHFLEALFFAYPSHFHHFVNIFRIFRKVGWSPNNGLYKQTNFWLDIGWPSISVGRIPPKMPRHCPTVRLNRLMHFRAENPHSLWEGKLSSVCALWGICSYENGMVRHVFTGYW